MQGTKGVKGAESLPAGAVREGVWEDVNLEPDLGGGEPSREGVLELCRWRGGLGKLPAWRRVTVAWGTREEWKDGLGPFSGMALNTGVRSQMSLGCGKALKWFEPHDGAGTVRLVL